MTTLLWTRSFAEHRIEIRDGCEHQLIWTNFIEFPPVPKMHHDSLRSSSRTTQVSRTIWTQQQETFTWALRSRERTPWAGWARGSGFHPRGSDDAMESQWSPWGDLGVAEAWGEQAARPSNWFPRTIKKRVPGRTSRWRTYRGPRRMEAARKR